MKVKVKVEVEVWDIEVVETSKNQGWYVFKYSIKVNGGEKIKSEDDGSWSGQTKNNFLKTLKNGYVTRLALESHF